MLGEQLAEDFNLNLNDELTILTSSGPKTSEIRFSQITVKKLISHKIYQQDKRTIYLKTNSDNLIYNFLDIYLPGKQSVTKINETIESVEEVLGDDYRFYPYWDEFSGLLEAVSLEKKSIVVIMQVIVLVALFNVLAFFIFLRETRVKKFFLHML